MTTGTNTSFGALLRRYREAAGLSQEELAERASLTANGVGALERGDRQRPYPITVQRLATALELGAEARAALIAAVPRHSESAAQRAGTTEQASGGDQGRATAGTTQYAALPTFLTPLIGRERDIANLVELLLPSAGPVRLLTLLGPGGVGKTRLALEAAHKLRDRFSDGAVFVALAALEDAGLVISTIAHAIGLRETGARPARELVEAALRTKRLLLVVDNCEHLLESATELAGIVAACPGVSILATSRAPLAISGERQYPVEPLALPDLRQVPTVQEVAQTAAAQLFVQRVQAMIPSFELSKVNAVTIAAICRRLDGIPLAIELAAAWVKLLGPTALLARLDRALPLLVGGAHDLPARQRTMRDTIAWSHNLLDADEQKVFRRLAVFAGGCTLEAAEAVCAGPGERLDVLTILSSLLDKSLVRRSDEAEEMRLLLLEIAREYGLERLEAQGERQEIQACHAAYFRTLAEEAEPYLTSGEREAWMPRLAAEQDNMRAALAWSLGGTGNWETGARLAGALGWFWFLHGDVEEGSNWLGRVQARLSTIPDTDPAIPLVLRANVLYGVAGMAWAVSTYKAALETLEQAIAYFRQIDEPRRLILALYLKGLIYIQLDEDSAALAPFQEGLALSRAVADRWAIAYTAQGLGLARWLTGEIAEARTLFDEALTLFQELRDPWGQSVTLYHRGSMAWMENDVGAARANFEQSIALVRGIGNSWDLARSLASLGQVLVHEDLRRAKRIFAEGLQLSRDLGDIVSILHGLMGGMSVAVAEKRFVEAARLYGAATNHVDSSYSQAMMRMERLAAIVRDELGEAAWTTAWSAGQALLLEEAIAEAFAVFSVDDTDGEADRVYEQA